MTDFKRVQRMIIIILVAIVLFSFVAIINLHYKVEDLSGAINVLFDYVEGGR